MSCGGWIFNRHRWHYIDTEHRICKKCGTCQYYGRCGELWIHTDFDGLLARHKKWVSREKKGTKSREKALGFIQSSNRRTIK